MIRWSRKRRSVLYSPLSPPPMRFFVRLLALPCLLALASGSALAQTCTTTWTNAAGGSWSTAANWSAGVPTAASVACVTAPGTYTVAASRIDAKTLLFGAAAGVQTLALAGPLALADSGVVAPTAVVEWTAEYLNAGRLVNRGLVRLTGATGSRGVRGETAVFRNEGRLEWSSTGVFYVYSGGRIENAATFEVTGTPTLLGYSGVGTFANEAAGTVTKTGAGTFTVSVAALDNAGTLAVGTGGGTIQVTSPATHRDPTFAVDAEGTISLAGRMTLAGTVSGAPAGRLIVSAPVTADGATLNVGGTGLEWTAEYLEAGRLVNTGRLRLTGVTGSRGVRGAGAVLRNDGQVEWSSTGVFYVYSGGRIENAATFEVTGTPTLLGYSGVGTFANEAAGTVTKTGAGTFTVSVAALDNAGTLAVGDGSAVSVTSPSTHRSPTFVVADAGALTFSGAVTLAGTVSGAPAGRLVVSAPVTSDDATLNVGGTGLEWTAEYLNAGRLVNRGLVRLTGATGSRGVRGETAVFRNEGRLEWSSTGVFYVYSGGRIENAATFEVTGTPTLLGYSGVGTFANEAAGTVTKTGAGTFTVSVAALDNAGTLAVGTGGGTIQVTSPATHRDPTFAVDAEGTISLAGRMTLAGTVSGAPAGRLIVSAPVTADGATLNVGGTGLEWTAEYLEAGRLVNTGRLRLTGVTGSRGVRGAGAVLRNDGQVEWSSTGVFYVYSGGRIENAATFEVTGTPTLLGYSGVGTFANEAAGTVTKTGAGTFTVSVAALDNAGTLAVGDGGGTLLVSSAATHSSPTFTVAEAGTLSLTGATTLAGAATGEPAGRLVVSGSLTAGSDAALALTGTGLEWTASYLEAGRLVNRGLVRLTGATGSRGVRGAGTVLRNEARVEWTGTGQVYVYAGGRFENAATLAVDGGGGLRGSSGVGTFVNEPDATFARSGAGTFTLGTGLAFDLGGAVRMEGTVSAAGAAITNRAAFSVGATPGAAARLTWTGAFAPTGDLLLDIGGAGAGHDLLVVLGRDGVTLGGTLTVNLTNGFAPAAGDTFAVVRATAFAGGLRDLTSLTAEAADVTLYPSLAGGAYVLTAAAGIPTLSGDLMATPTTATNGRPATVALAGEGFAPDLSVALECRGCATPEAFGTIPGRFVEMTPTAFAATFDLTSGDIFGPYEIVLRDPRGGVVSAGFVVADGPAVLSIAVLNGQASEVGRRPGLFVLRSNRRVREPVDVPFRLSGSAQLYVDYMTDVVGSRVTLPAGRDSLVVAIFPLNDALVEPSESVTFQLLYTGQTGTRSATLSIEDGPPDVTFAVYTTSPRAGGNAGSTTISVGGQGFTSASTVALTGGGATLAPDVVSVNDAGTFLEATFDLTRQPLGSRTIVVQSGAGDEALRPGAFTVEPGRYPEVDVQVLAPARVPRTRVRTYTLLLHNRGNVDVLGYPSLSGLPAGAAWETDFTVQPPGGGAPVPWHEFASTFENEDGMVVTLPVVALGPGEYREIEIRAAATQATTLRLVGTWVYLH